MPIAVDDVYVDESRPFAQFTIRLTAPSAQPVSFSYNNSNETAANGSDYVAQSGTLTFAPGQTVLTLDIPLIGDSLLEATQAFTLNLFSPVNSTIATPFARAIIVDNDQPSGVPVVRVSDQTVDEAAGKVSFVVRLDKPSSGNVSVSYATVDGTALGGTDFTALATQTLTFAPGEMVKVVTVDLLDEGLAEGREYFDLLLSSPVGATLLPQPSGRASIGANDATAVALPSITVADAVADESGAFLEFVVSLSAPSTQSVSVSYNNSNVTAANGSDYVARSSAITFLPGETTKVVKIAVLNTAGSEQTEVAGLNLFSAVNATIGRPLAYGTLFDNDQTAGTPVIRVQAQTVDEAAGQIRFTVTLDRPGIGNVSVNVATANGTALAGSDYSALATQTLTFTPGEMVKVVTVDLTNDVLAEGREYFDLLLSSPVGATLLPQPSGRASIGANDATAVSSPLITVADAVADESGTFLEFVVSLSAPSTQSVSVSYNNSNVTAANGSDYVAQASTLTFAPGETTKVVQIPVLNTAGIEPTEVVGLNLFSAVNATIGRPLAYGTIFDNDRTSGTPMIRVQDQTVDEAEGQVHFIVTLDRPSIGNVSVNVATANGTALAGSDYSALATQTLTFTPGEMVKVVTVDLTNDVLAEGREYFDLLLSSPVGATLLPQPSGRASIGANDATAVSSPLITVADAVADESGTFLEFVVSLSAPSTQSVSVSYNNSNVTAANGSDYVAQASTLTFAPGETTKVVQIPVLNTAGIEPTEVVGLNLFSAVNATIGRPLAYGTIFDNDRTSGTPVIRVTDQIIDEASGKASVVIALDKPSTGNVSVSVATANGTALSGSDYVALATQTLTFTPGEMVKVVSIDLNDDTANEAGEHFDLTLSAPIGATLPDTNARIFIAPSDAPAAALPRISVSDASAGESDASLAFVVSLSAPSSQVVKVNYNNSNVTAANGSDYVAQASTLTFAPGETTKVLQIPVLDGLVAEPTETIRLNLSGAVNATIARPAGFGTIFDNDMASGTPNLSVSDGIVNESEPRAAFTVTLDKPSTSQVTVSYATANGNASVGTDYAAQSAQTLVFAPGEVSKTVHVDLLNDAAAESPEFFDLRLVSAVNAVIADSRGHMVIAQSDTPPAALPAISASSIAATEGSAYLEFDLVLSAPSTQTVRVSYNNSNVTAANGSDYVAQASVVTFEPGETLHTVRIALLDNLVAEASETFGLNLFGAVNATVATPSVPATILDNDGPPPASQLLNNGTGSADVLVGRAGSNAVSGGGGNDVLDGVDGVTMAGGGGSDLYIVESASDLVTEAVSAGTDTVVSYVDYALAANVENLILRGAAVTGTGNTLNNSISGHAGANTLNGGAGADTLTGGAGNDTFVFDNTSGRDTVADWDSATDTFRFSMAGLHIGDSDTAVEGAVVRAAPGGFSSSAELVVFTTDIVGAITTTSAAAAIGSATAAYAAGARVLFAVDNGTQTGVFMFNSAGADALVSAGELTQLVLANGDATTLGDYLFGV
ncbi:MAG: Calx-beta domain-containing protein [Caldimonas sp.]